MSPIEPVSKPGRERPVLNPSSSPHGLGRLLAGDPAEAAADSRRVAGGFIVLVALTAIVLNVGVYRSQRDRDERERWGRLQAEAQDRASRVRTAVEGFQREVQGVAQALVPGSAHRTSSLEVTLAQSARLLGWRAAAIHATSRGTLAAVSDGPMLPGPDSELLSRVIETGKPSVTRLDGPGIAGDWVVAIAPSAASPGGGHALIVWSDLDALVGPAVAPRGRMTGVGSYLAGLEAGHTVILGTIGGTNVEPSAHRQLPSDREREAAEAAADGIRSQLVLRDGRRETWIITLFLPELECGLVTSAPRDVLGPAADQAFAGLVAFDVAIALLVVASLIFWRRQYQIGLARRELQVTRRHADRTQAVFDSAFDAILTFGMDGRIRTANRAAERILQRPADDLAGQTFDALVRLEDAAIGANVEAASGRVSRGVIQRRDGGFSPVELSVAETGSGTDRMYTVVVRDISQKIEAERQIRDFAQGLELSNRRLAELNAQLEEGSRLKSEFLANTSHELRTPLNGMIGFLQLVLDGMCSSPEEEREFLRQALDCSRHLLGLINDVLDIAKIEAGKLTLEIEEVEPRKLLEEVYSVTHIQAVPKGLKLIFDVPDQTTTTVRADSRKAKQVLINLVGNAIKFTPAGSVTVRATEQAKLGYWRFEVIDTGIGIPPDRQSKVFEKFVQADGSTTRTYGGTGLGLAISRSLVELMGGIIGVDSEGEGRGTRMHFSLPIWRPILELPEADEHAGEQIAGPAGGPLVLIVEDDPAFRTYVTSLLHRHGYRTAEAVHAEGAWVLARRLRPAIVVLDYALTCAEGATMRTGWDLAERMTQDDRTRHIPLIFVTGFDEEVLHRLKRNSFSRGLEHLGKPIEAPALLAKIDQMLGEITSRPVRALMADDDPSIVAFVRKVLPENRFHIEVANNGDECLHILRVQPRGFDILLLDLMMPGVSGYDVLRELALSGDYRDLPVLILTNFPEARTDEERKLLETGEVLDVLPKTSIHDHPMILPHIIDWHLQVRRGDVPGTDGGAPDSDPGHNWQEAA